MVPGSFSWVLTGIFWNLRALVILLLALPVVVGFLVWIILEKAIQYGSWPITAAVQFCYVQPLKRLIVRYVYPTRLGRCHLMCTRRKGGSAKQHSHIVRVKAASGCSIYPIPCLDNNYSYLVVTERRGKPLPCVVIDPGDAAALLSAMEFISTSHYSGTKLELRAILTTHKHWDHCGGNLELCRRIPGLEVYGCARERVPGVTHTVQEGDVIAPVDTLQFEVLETPCHTRGHVIFVLDAVQESWKSDAPRCLFSGDTLFLGGHGAHFEGTQEEMLQNLAKIARTLGPETLVFPGHEYTVANLSHIVRYQSPFDSPAAFLLAAGQWWRAVHRRWWHHGLPTVPGRLADELVINPKFRELQRYAELVEASAQRPDRSGKPEPSWFYTPECDFEVTPADVAHPFVTLWKSDYDRHLAMLKARRTKEAVIELESAVGRFKSWKEPWSRGGAGKEREVPTKKELEQALRALGCPAGGKGLSLPLLKESLGAFLGREMPSEDAELLQERCKGAKETWKRRSKRGLSEFACAAAELLRDRESCQDCWQGYAPTNCMVCTCGKGAPCNAPPSVPASPMSEAGSLSPSRDRMKRNRSFGLLSAACEGDISVSTATEGYPGPDATAHCVTLEQTAEEGSSGLLAPPIVDFHDPKASQSSYMMASSTLSERPSERRASRLSESMRSEPSHHKGAAASSIAGRVSAIFSQQLLSRASSLSYGDGPGPPTQIGSTGMVYRL